MRPRRTTPGAFDTGETPIFGARATLVSTAGAPDDVVYERPLGTGCAALLELRVDPEAITTRVFFSAMRVRARTARGR